MSKNKITLDSINKEWYSDDFNHNAPIIKKYYSKLSKEKEREIRADTIEYIHLPKQKVYVAQTYHGNIAIGSNTDLYKSIRGFNKSHKKKVRRDERKRQKKNKNYGGKRKMKNKTKKTLKSLALGCLGVATLVGAGATINHFVNGADENGLVKVNLKYDIGGLDANGAYEETDESIYTKNAFEAQGLKVTMDFDSNIDYELFFYDQYGDFISSTGALDKNFEGELPFGATHSRIEITPKEDEDGIKWYEKSGYASQLTIKVNEEQKDVDMSKNLFVYHGLTAFDHTNAGFQEGDGAISSEFVDITDYDKLLLNMNKKYLNNTNFKFYVYDVGETISFELLDINEYDIVENGDMVSITIDNIGSFEKCMVATFDKTDTSFSVELYGVK